MRGAFKESKLDNIVITKNTEMVYYLYNDEDLQLIGIDKTTCSALKMQFVNGQIDEITFLVSPNGNVYPEDELPINDRTLKGFTWRIVQRPETIEDLFDENDQEEQFPEILKFQYSRTKTNPRKDKKLGSMLKDDFLKYQAKTTPQPLGISIAKAKGVYLTDTEGKKYLDFVAGVSACSLGHCHPKVTKNN